jgi:hypothetical protein
MKYSKSFDKIPDDFKELPSISKLVEKFSVTDPKGGLKINEKLSSFVPGCFCQYKL